VASPVKIPLPLDQLAGRPYTGNGEEDLRRGISTGCGGSQCVSITRVRADRPDLDCDTIARVVGIEYRYSDEDGEETWVMAERGGTVAVEVTDPCPEQSATPDVPSQLPTSPGSSESTAEVGLPVEVPGTQNGP
jgi:hypothetical protein